MEASIAFFLGWAMIIRSNFYLAGKGDVEDSLAFVSEGYDKEAFSEEFFSVESFSEFLKYSFLDKFYLDGEASTGLATSGMADFFFFGDSGIIVASASDKLDFAFYVAFFSGKAIDFIGLATAALAFGASAAVGTGSIAFAVALGVLGF